MFFDLGKSFSCIPNLQRVRVQLIFIACYSLNSICYLNVPLFFEVGREGVPSLDSFNSNFLGPKWGTNKPWGMDGWMDE
jgi:hypothetical protein